MSEIKGTMFLDKLEKAKSEMDKTNQRINKLNSQKSQMEQARALMAQSDQPRSLKQNHSEYKLQIQKMLQSS